MTEEKQPVPMEKMVEWVISLVEAYRDALFSAAEEIMEDVEHHLRKQMSEIIEEQKENSQDA